MESRIYVLECAEGRFYVDTLSFFIEIVSEDIINYFRHNCCEWTKRYEPLRVLQVLKNSSAAADVDQVTKNLMKCYGINFVRGGRYSRIKLSDGEIKCLQREGVDVSQQLRFPSNGQESLTPLTPGSPVQSYSPTSTSSSLSKSDLSDRIIKFVLESLSVHSLPSEEIHLSFKRRGDEIVLDVNHDTQTQSSSSPKSYKFSNKRSRRNYDITPLKTTPPTTPPRTPRESTSVRNSSSSTREKIFLSPSESPRYQFDLFPSTSVSKSLPLPNFIFSSSKD